MKGNLLILGSLAQEYRRLMAPVAPELHIIISLEYGADMIEAAPEIDFLLAYIIPEELLKRAAQLKWIQLTSAGANQVLFSPHLREDVIVTTARGVHSPQMAEYVLGIMVALARNLPQMVRHQDQRMWKQWPGQTLAGKTVGILGFGRVGQEVAKLARAFSMKVVGLRRSGPPHPLADQMFGPQELNALLEVSDFLVVALPLTHETRGLLAKKQLAQMKKGAFLVNVSRGGVVEEEALVEALAAGHLAGAACDVFSSEPLPQDSPLWAAPNLLITPHIAGLSHDYPARVAHIFLENLSRFKQGEPLMNQVDRQRGY